MWGRLATCGPIVIGPSGRSRTWGGVVCVGNPECDVRTRPRVPHRHFCRCKRWPNVDTFENTGCEASGPRPDGPIDNRSAGWQPAPQWKKVFISIGVPGAHPKHVPSGAYIAVWPRPQSPHRTPTVMEGIVKFSPRQMATRSGVLFCCRAIEAGASAATAKG